MTTLADVRGYQRFEQNLTRRLERDLRALLGKIVGLDPDRQRDALLELFPSLIGPYMTAMAQFAATWAEDLFSEASGRSPRVSEVDTLDPEQTNATVRWAVGPLFGEGGTVFERLTRAGQRMVANAGRASVISTQGR